MSRLRRLFSFLEPERARPVPPAAELPAGPARHEDGATNPGSVPAGVNSDITDTLDRVLSEIGRVGREQFRATTLIEGQGTTLDELAEAWREHLDRRDDEVAELRRALTELEGQARLGPVKELLPVADALSASVRAARELAATLHTPPEHHPSLVERLRGRSGGAAPADDRSAAMEAWLNGVLLIERRLLALLEREGVRPIEAVGRAFDPQRHLAVAAAPTSDVPDGTVVSEELRGYTVGERVLRHAEVIVARNGTG